jgi:hypothetical protein
VSLLCSLVCSCLSPSKVGLWTLSPAQMVPGLWLLYRYDSFLGGGGVVLQADTSTAERYSPHQMKQHISKVQAPAPKGTSRLVGRTATPPQKEFHWSFPVIAHSCHCVWAVPARHAACQPQQ